MKKGFTLIEILVVVAILGMLMGVFVFAFRNAPDKAKKGICEDYVRQIATAIEKGLTDNTLSPAIYRNSGGENGLDEMTAYCLAGSLGCETKNGKLSGHDRFGIVTPWAREVIKDLGSSCSLSSEVASGGNIRDHRLHYAIAIDDEEENTGGGIVTADVGGEQVRIRANVAVWCAGADGKMEPYSRGLRSDDVYSWSYEQTVR